MKLTAMLVVLVTAFCISANAKNCVEGAKVISPRISEAAMAAYNTNYETAKKNFTAQQSADNLIWVARRQAYLGKYKEAINTLTEGIAKYPNDARMYRHRGHRFITIRCFDDAIADLEKAALLIKGKLDEIEPDGLPNERNIPTSTLQSNIWYHLGLAYYLKGDFVKALHAYNEAEKVSKNPDMLVATKHWQYMTLRRLGNRDEALNAVREIADTLDIIENDDYYKLVKLYKGTASGETLLTEFEAAADSVSKASLGYGLGNRWLYHNRFKEATDIFKKIVAGNQWASFGYIAAETELSRRKNER
jgi:tetratricopeptide (TPR) repeat protein